MEVTVVNDLEKLSS